MGTTSDKKSELRLTGLNDEQEKDTIIYYHLLSNPGMWYHKK